MPPPSQPPPVTPSPHRFVINKQPPPPKNPTTQEKSSRLALQQFRATPRFSFPSTPKPTASQRLVSPTPTTLRSFTPIEPPLRQDDAIDNYSDADEDVHDSIETADCHLDAEYLSGDVEDIYTIAEHVSKRRRISSSPALPDERSSSVVDGKNEDILPDPLLSTLPTLSSPVHRRSRSAATPRFLISTPIPQPTPQPTETPFLRPPRFRAPEPSEQTQPPSDPLPDQFSPHRRGQKYVSGGLAAEVRDWLMNVETTVAVNAAQKSKDDPWLLRLLIDEVSGGGKPWMTLVSGRKFHSDEGGMIDTRGIFQVILAGEGEGIGLQKGARVEVGKTVGIKGPVWEAVIKGEKWGVGVDWKVLT